MLVYRRVIIENPPYLEVSDGFRFVMVPPVIIQVMNEQFHIETDLVTWGSTILRTPHMKHLGENQQKPDESW
jgi:hypothetical protein